MVRPQIFRQGILFGAVATEAGGTGERCSGIEQVDAVGGGIGREGVAIATAGQEIERHHSERTVRIPSESAAAHHHIQVVALAVLNREVEDAAAGGLGEVETESHTAHLRKASLIRV